MNYVVPKTTPSNIAACLLTPFKSRVVTLCYVPVLMAV